MAIHKLHYEEGNTKQWETMRDSMDDRLGGSEIGTVAGHNSYCSAFTLFCRKVGAVASPILSKKEAIVQGHDGEDGVAIRFCREMKKTVHRENCIYTNDDYAHLKASIDRKVTGEDSGLECKTAKDMAMKKYKHGDFPMSYFDQCLLYLAVTQLKRWYLAIQVFGTAFRMFLMTTVKSEAEEYERLKVKFAEWERFKKEHFTEWTWDNNIKKFVYEGKGEKNLPIPDDIADFESEDFDEWETKWCKLESVYYVDPEEFAACEQLAQIFIGRVKQVDDAMASWKPDENVPEDADAIAEARQATLIATARSVWPMDEIDGSDSTIDTVGEIAPDVVVDSVATLDESSELMAYVIRRDEVSKAIKELETELGELENKVALFVGETETTFVPGWKVTYKMGSGREFASAAKVKEYFESKGEAVPNGLITVSEGKRSLRFWTNNGKSKKGKKGA